MLHSKLRKREDRLEQNKFFCASVKCKQCSKRREIVPYFTDSKNRKIKKSPPSRPLFLVKVNKYTKFGIDMAVHLSFLKKRKSSIGMLIGGFFILFE